MTIISDTSSWPRSPLACSVVVIGSGPAGMTVARDIHALGHTVVVLESGDLVQTDRARDLNDGDVTGGSFRFGRQDVSLRDVRMRALGGSSGHWNGVCRPLDPWDFDDRPDLGRAGWPIEFTELELWYEQAHATCDMGTYGYDANAWFGALGGPAPIRNASIDTTLYRLSPTQFGIRYRSDLEASADVQVILDASVTRLSVTPDARHVRAVTATSSTGLTVEVVPEIVVIATGGIETPRLLLNNDPRRGGLANTSGLVGRGFMEHPHVRLGRLALSTDAALLGMYRQHQGAGPFADSIGWAALTLTEETVRARGLIGGALTFEADDGPPDHDASDLGPGVAELVGGQAPAPLLRATLRTEQLPFNDHAVELSRRRDSLGQRLPRVRWTADPITLQALQQLIQTIADELGGSGIGRLEMLPMSGALHAEAVEIGCHHMGTARMSHDPRSGVVDPECFTHDIDNLCVAGSSVFPTGGYSNPTLTIVALAHRLAAAIDQRLSSR